jgi:predicted enzyme related to lactoylglutathione lyase
MTTATAVKNDVVWFEIPSSDFKRAVTFYETILGKELQKTFQNVADTLHAPRTG